MEEFAPAPRPTPITLRLIMDNSLTKEELARYNALDADEAAESARRLKTIHLEWKNIVEIAGLEMFELAEVLYIQRNRIERIEGLECMPKLQFLALQRNRISVIQNLECLRDLEFLDLSGNLIEDLDEHEIPATVNNLSLQDNPCSLDKKYKEKLLARLPDLYKLDGKTVLEQEEPDARALLDAASAAVAEPAELLATEKGLGAYWRKGEMQSNVTASIKEQIDQYCVEALGDVEVFDRQVEDATARSKARREGLNSAQHSAGRLSQRLSTPLKDLSGTGRTLT